MERKGGGVLEAACTYLPGHSIIDNPLYLRLRSISPAKFSSASHCYKMSRFVSYLSVQNFHATGAKTITTPCVFPGNIFRLINANSYYYLPACQERLLFYKRKVHRKKQEERGSISKPLFILLNTYKAVISYDV